MRCRYRTYPDNRNTFEVIGEVRRHVFGILLCHGVVSSNNLGFERKILE